MINELREGNLIQSDGMPAEVIKVYKNQYGETSIDIRILKTGEIKKGLTAKNFQSNKDLN